MKKCLVIARFNENLDWIKEHKDYKIIVYNKGKEILDNENFDVINLKNVGRESHTYLYHIVNNYEKLDDVNIFLQGRINDLNSMAFLNPNDYLKNINKFGFSVSRYGLLGPFHWSWNVGVDKDIRYQDKWISNEISRSNIGFRYFAKKLFPDIPLFVATSYSGCFAVKKDLIKQNEIGFYKKLLNILSKNKDPIEGHYMERLWCYIFTKNTPLIDSCFDVIKTKNEKFNLW